MNLDDFAWMLYDLEPGRGDVASLLQFAEGLCARGKIEAAATAADLAFAIAPDDDRIAVLRAELLAALAVREHGLNFRYVPGRSYRMGSEDGDPDEQPVHNVKLSPFWLSDTPISWAAFCRLLRWPPPRKGLPSEKSLEEMLSTPSMRRTANIEMAPFILREASKIRLQYCENSSAHAEFDWRKVELGKYDLKPMVAVAWQEAEYLAKRISTSRITYRLPTEAEWEAAARGGLASARYPWGDSLPTHECCDFGRFDDFSVQPSRTYQPNGYGLYAMSGGVWEWTSDRYDALYYAHSPRDDPTGAAVGEQRVVRGGSWADCAAVVTTSFRMSRAASPFWEGTLDGHFTPNIGFRLCRVMANGPV